ncbi:hypothetical protein HMPREF9134_00774 [Porphyromonas catoniae F0037]|uniref:Uncharacterized protein n=1 Tax=Porphyromonas catoniae F0037 TaxID=1127696 RepID=L1NDY4_9PORP|nr:hypothetical protein HMPREF9134_00774 [Porphyromonas catoniae F0037]
MPSKLLNGRGLIGYVAIHRSGFLYFVLVSPMASSTPSPLFSLVLTLPFCTLMAMVMFLTIPLEYPLA